MFGVFIINSSLSDSITCRRHFGDLISVKAIYDSQTIINCTNIPSYVLSKDVNFYLTSLNSMKSNVIKFHLDIIATEISTTMAHVNSNNVLTIDNSGSDHSIQIECILPDLGDSGLALLEICSYSLPNVTR